MIDGILLVGFGGPTPGCCERRANCPRTPGCEAECFVAGIFGDNPARRARVEEVTHHYHTLGGFSPYNPLTEAQASALQAALAARGHALPVGVGYRHWRPWVKDGVSGLRQRGCTQMLVVVLAPHQSSVSWDWYLKTAAEAVEALGPGAPIIADVLPPWWNTTGFVSANAARVREATAGWAADRFNAAELIFTAHAVPRPVESTSPYRSQFAETARLTAEALGHPQHVIAFQSQPSDSAVPWSAPTISEALRAAKAAGRSEVVVQAAGFLVDHTEVLYDLDHEAAAEAKALGLGFTRARCVHDHADFIAMLADGIIARCSAAASA